MNSLSTPFNTNTNSNDSTYWGSTVYTFHVLTCLILAATLEEETVILSVL